VAPKKANRRSSDYYLNLTIPPRVASKLKRDARKQGQTLSGWVRIILNQAVGL
jgi:predicted HicB family RNase H-like nuclease